jgi:AcrR family transcriptional regulator
MHLPSGTAGVRPPEGRPPQARVLRHDALLVDSAAAVLAEAGWGGLTFAKVAAVMGMSGQPVRSRVRNRAELATRVWQQRAAQPLIESLGGCLSGVQEALSSGRTDPVVQAWESFGLRRTSLEAAAELLIVAHYDPAVAEAVLADLRELLCPWITPGEGVDEETAARTAFAICLGLGILLMSRHERAATPGIRKALQSRAQALIAPSQPGQLPDVTALHLIDYPELAPGDPALDLLLNATLELVGERGFDGVRVAEIARAAGFTEGLVYSRYASKLELFQDAVKRQNEAGFEVNRAFTERLRAEHGLGMAEAVLMREYQLPSHRIPRLMALEQIRLTWHSEELMRQATLAIDEYRAGLLQDPAWQFEGEADFFLDYAITLGVAVLPIISPEAYRLPYDVVTVPLYEMLGA